MLASLSYASTLSSVRLVITRFVLGKMGMWNEAFTQLTGYVAATAAAAAANKKFLPRLLLVMPLLLLAPASPSLTGDEVLLNKRYTEKGAGHPTCYQTFFG